MNTTSRNQTRKQAKRQEGFALVVVLLSATVLLVALLAVTSTLALSSRRSTTDQRVTLQAQYAAESGLSRAQSKLSEVQSVLGGLRVPANTNASAIERHAQNFCGTALSAQRVNGEVLCDTVPVEAGDGGRFSLFTDYIPQKNYPRGTTPSEYWLEVFYGDPDREDTEVAGSGSGAQTRYRTSFNLVPTAVRFMKNDDYRFEFNVSPIQSTGEVVAGNRVMSTRTVRLETPNTFEVAVKRPSFSEYVLFRNQTQAVGGGQLYFTDGERFNGPVHTNEQPGLASWRGGLPGFLDKFTTAAERPRYSGNIGPDDYLNVFMGDEPLFKKAEVPLPTSNNNQLRAAFGGDPSDSSTVRERDLKAVWNVSELDRGVYYSRGNGSAANSGSSWQGGLYVKGDVKDLTFSTQRGKQVIRITQQEILRVEKVWDYGYYRYNGRRYYGWHQDEVPVYGPAKTITFRQTGENAWDVEENGRTKPLSGNFNGMIYVDGNIKNLGGDGTNAADIAAKSQLTLATTGDITVKKSITYTDDPREKEDATNVLGIYTNGGSVLLDGPSENGSDIRPGDLSVPTEDINLHASVMASAPGEGFGTYEPNEDRGFVSNGRLARINLLGGIIEDQSQTVGSNTGGYKRNYNFDPRFADGFAPPYFPTQTNWEGDTKPFTRQPGLWEARGQ